MGDWDRKSGYAVHLEYEKRALEIQNKRLKILNDDFNAFISSDTGRALDWLNWLKDRPKKELTEDEKRLEAMEDLTLIYARMKE